MAMMTDWLGEYMERRDDEENEIIVQGTRKKDDPFGDSGLLGVDDFDFNDINLPPPNPWINSGGGGSSAPPHDNKQTDEQPEEAAETEEFLPSEGQEDFAEDGNPFNDGEPPTKQTVVAWLEQMVKDGIIDNYFIKDIGENGGYQGTYSGEWVDMTFYWTGGDLYELLPTYPSEPLPDDLDLTWNSSDDNYHIL